MQTKAKKQKTTKTGTTDQLEFIKLNDPKLLLRWYLDKYSFVKVDLIKIADVTQR
jgi:hypothetical protein